MTILQEFSPVCEIDRIVHRIETGVNPLALSTGERIVASIIYDRSEWRPEPYTELEAALERLGEWKDATMDYCRSHGYKSWRGYWSKHPAIEQQNDIMVQALRDMYEIYMRFDYPHPEEFGMIALKTLKKIGRLKD